MHIRVINPNTTRAGMEASLSMAGFFLELAREKRNHPDGLLVSKLIEAVVTDDDGTEQHLSDDDVAAFSVLHQFRRSLQGAHLRGARDVAAVPLHPELEVLVRVEALRVDTELGHGDRSPQSL